MANHDTPHQNQLRKARFSQPYGLYFLTKCVAQDHGLSEQQRENVVHALYWYRGLGKMRLHAFIIMTDHWHVLLSLGLTENLSVLMRNICRNAGFLSRKTGESICWQKGFYDHKVREHENVVDIIRYIESNPVRKGLTAKSESWQWSSAHPQFNGRNDRNWLGHERWEK
ncbi:MAG: transposase [Lentisphaerae bacterium]|nr:transposase [Lentisphaerota bacterium]